MIEPGASIAISAGTTTYAVAHELRNVADLTVVTNSPRVAELLHDPSRDDLTVILTGGVRTPVRRPRRAGRGRGPARPCTSTRWSSACTASTSGPG